MVDREGGPGDPRNPVDDYAATNLHLHRKTLMGADLCITMRNVFDVDARDPSSAPSPPSDDTPGRK